MDDWWYSSRNRIIRTGLCVVTYCLTPAAEGEGGFCCIPGSHKSPFIHAIPPSVKQFETAAAYVVQPVLEAGDVVIFTEALVHGTLPWRGPHERRVLLFKYNPGHCASSGNYLDPAAFPFLTEQQRRILGPPSLYDRAEVLPESR